MKAAVMFSGQGAQHPGMMRDIFEQYPTARGIFDKGSALLGKDIYELSMNATQEELDRTENTQPCLLTCELAAFHVYQELGLPCDASLGFSLGEWTALAAAEAADEPDIIAFIAKRAAAMQRAVPAGEGGMAAILGKDAQFVTELCQSIGDVYPSNYNCPGNITVSGTACAIDKVLEEAAVQEFMASKVAISIPSHCPLMLPAAEELHQAIQGLALREPQKQFVMNATGISTRDIHIIRENLLKQLCQPVLFQQSIEYLLNKDYDTFVEIGPGKTLSGMVKRIVKNAGRQASIFQFNSIEGIRKIKEFL